MNRLIPLCLIAACSGSPEPASPKEQFAQALRVYGEAAVQVFFADSLRERAPELFRLLDVNQDNLLQVAEIEQIDWLSPVVAVVVLKTIERLREHKPQ